MKILTDNRYGLLKIVTIILFFNTLLFANSMNESERITAQPLHTSVSTTSEKIETTEVSLDSFGTLGILLMVVLSSLLGAFFMKDELSNTLE